MSNRKSVGFASYESVELPIYYRPAKVKLKAKVGVGNGDSRSSSEPSEPAFRIYDSFQIAFYESGRWRTVRAPTLVKAKAKGRQIAMRLARNGSAVEDLSPEERRMSPRRPRSSATRVL